MQQRLLQLLQLLLQQFSFSFEVVISLGGFSFDNELLNVVNLLE
jgi:hypothetical protein